jgi:outer membrane biosynthesis protein TonB
MLRRFHVLFVLAAAALWAQDSPGELRVTHSVQPAYPSSLRTSRIRVSINVRVALKPDGSASNIRLKAGQVLQSLGDLASDEQALKAFFTSAAAAASQWTFACDGPAGSCPAVTNIRFEFGDGAASGAISR